MNKFTGKKIASNTKFELYVPFNSMDTNYHIYDLNKDITYLIDIHDVHDNEKDLDEYGGILRKDLIQLDYDLFIDTVWKEINS